MPPSGDVAVVIPARNEADRIGATGGAAAGLPGVDIVVVVDDGSADETAAAAGRAGAAGLGQRRNRCKAAAMETGAGVVWRIEQPQGRAVPHHLLFLDGDLRETAANAAPLAAPVRSTDGDLCIENPFTLRDQRVA